MARKHAHKYFFGRRVAGTQVWSCALPECNHYMPKHMEDFVQGKLSRCWSCDEEFEMGPAQMEMDKPFCNDCRAPGLSEAIAQEMDSFTSHHHSQSNSTNNDIKDEQIDLKTFRELCPSCGKYQTAIGYLYCGACVPKKLALGESVNR